MAAAMEHNPSIVDDVAAYLLLDLKRELELLEQQSQNQPGIMIPASGLLLKSIFFGGGTPSLMAAKFVENIVNFLCKKYSVDSSLEISMEANPATFTLRNLWDFRCAGINRMSLGIQSFSDIGLQFLGRIYTAQQALSATELIAKIFTNFSCDFIYGYAQQTSGDLEKDLSTAINFGCKHISCYQLTYEDGTVFFEKLLSGDLRPMDEKNEVQLYDFIGNYLQTKEIFRYEISNYAKPSCECIHNMNYWRYGDYLGIGPGAHSRLTIAGRKNEIVKIEDPQDWCDSLRRGNDARAHTAILSEREELEEMMLMGLRLEEGIGLKAFELRGLQRHIDGILKSDRMQFLMRRRLMQEHPQKLQLTANGRKKLDSVVKFLLVE
jgi:oxygen-independent coproporphyrinogen-3 oxidase